MDPAIEDAVYRLSGPGGRYALHTSELGLGRLIRLSKFRGDPRAVAYIVAVTEPSAAIDFISRRFAGIDDQLEDLGRVSGALLKALGLSSGEFLRVDSTRLT